MSFVSYLTLYLNHLYCFSSFRSSYSHPTCGYGYSTSPSSDCHHSTFCHHNCSPPSPHHTPCGGYKPSGTWPSYSRNSSPTPFQPAFTPWGLLSCPWGEENPVASDSARHASGETMPKGHSWWVAIWIKIYAFPSLRIGKKWLLAGLFQLLGEGWYKTVSMPGSL